MTTRGKQQLSGFFIAATGAAFTGWTWYTELLKGYFNIRASLIFPAFVIIGLALMIVPGYKEERIARGENVSRLHGARLITRRWWGIVIAALAAGGLNYLLLLLMR